MRNAPDNQDDIIDSRDVIKRIEELDAEREALVDDIAEKEEAQQEAEQDLRTAKREELPDSGEEALSEALEEAQTAHADALEALKDWNESDEGKELKILQALASEGEDSSDWAHGETLVRDSYWTDYVREMLEDCGSIPKGLPDWVVLDWDATAENVKADYSSIDFDGETYWIRS